MIRFLQLSDTRSGTMMLTDALDHHYSCLQFYNLYASNPDDSEGHQKLWEQFQQAKEEGITHKGTTMHRVGDGWIKTLSPTQPQQFWSMVRDHHDRWICLHRENLLRRFLSHKVGVVLKSYRVSKPRKKDPGSVVLPIQELLEFIGNTQILREKIDVYFPERLVLTYEQLVTDWNATILQVQEYLNLPLISVKPITYLQEKRPLREAIQNYDEVASYLSNRGCNEWLND